MSTENQQSNGLTADASLATDNARLCLYSIDASHPRLGNAQSGRCEFCSASEASEAPPFVSVSLEDPPKFRLASHQRAIGADDADSDGVESWVVTEDAPALAQEASRGQTPRFDDDDAEYLWSSDSDLDWDSGPFDYEVPFENPLLHEVYAFEHRYPRAAPVVRALLRLPAARQAQNLQEHIVDAYNGGTNGAEQAAQAARYIISEVGRTGATVTEEARRRGHNISTTVQRRWPAVVHALGDGWLGSVAELVREGAASVPPMEL